MEIQWESSNQHKSVGSYRSTLDSCRFPIMMVHWPSLGLCLERNPWKQLDTWMVAPLSTHQVFDRMSVKLASEQARNKLLSLPLDSNQVFLFRRFTLKWHFFPQKKPFFVGSFLPGFSPSFGISFLTFFLPLYFFWETKLTVIFPLALTLRSFWSHLVINSFIVYGVEFWLYASLNGPKEEGRESGMNCIKYPTDIPILTSFSFTTRFFVVKICSLTPIVPLYFKIFNWFIEDGPKAYPSPQIDFHRIKEILCIILNYKWPPYTFRDGIWDDLKANFITPYPFFIIYLIDS